MKRITKAQKAEGADVSRRVQEMYPDALTKSQETALFGPEDHEGRTVHTPGPWHPLCEISDLEGNNWKFTIAGPSRPLSYGGQVATAWGRDLTREEVTANANLIAASPELLSALNKALDFIVPLVMDDETERNALIPILEAVIRKAEGRS